MPKIARPRPQRKHPILTGPGSTAFAAESILAIAANQRVCPLRLRRGNIQYLSSIRPLGLLALVVHFDEIRDLMRARFLRDWRQPPPRGGA